MEKLPEKWCIKWGSRENFEIISTYLGKIGRFGWIYTSDIVHSDVYVDNTNQYYGRRKPELPEITFEQFCNWVLNAPIISEPLIFN